MENDFGALGIDLYIRCLQESKGVSSDELCSELPHNPDDIANAVDELLSQQIIFEENGRFYAEPVDKVADLFREKNMQTLASFLPMIGSCCHADGKGFKISSFSGSEGVKKIHEDILATLIPLDESQKFLYQMSSSQDLFEVIPDHQEHFIDKRIEAEILLYWMAPNKDCYWPHAYKPDENFRFAKFFNIEAFPFHMELDVYHNKVAIICLHEGSLNGLIIEDVFVAESFRSMSRFLWGNLQVFED